MNLEENAKENKEVELEGKVKLITNTRENSRNDIELHSKPDENLNVLPHKNTIDEPIRETLVILLGFCKYFLKNSLEI